jgi:cell division septum initiation protein DivIVA
MNCTFGIACDNWSGHERPERLCRREKPVESESASAFTRTFRGYQPTAVDAHIEMLTTKQQLLLDDVENLRGRLGELGNEAGALRKEVELLTDTSPAPHAVQQRMAKLLRSAVDEVAEMHAEARAEAEAMVEAAETEAKAVATRREAMEADYAKSKEKLEADLAALRADAQETREQLLADAKLEADHHREQAQRAVDEASQQRIDILEQLMGVYRDLEGVPASLESAYQQVKNPPE